MLFLNLLSFLLCFCDLNNEIKYFCNREKTSRWKEINHCSICIVYSYFWIFFHWRQWHCHMSIKRSQQLRVYGSVRKEKQIKCLVSMRYYCLEVSKWFHVLWCIYMGKNERKILIKDKNVNISLWICFWIKLFFLTWNESFA